MCACLDLSVSSSSWGLGRAAFCDCGTLWTFLLPFFEMPCKLSDGTSWEKMCIKCQSIIENRVACLLNFPCTMTVKDSYLDRNCVDVKPFLSFIDVIPI